MEKISIWQKGEYTYPLAFDFEPNLRPYLIDDSIAAAGEDQHARNSATTALS